MRNLHRISGHCDGSATECPGTRGYPLLPKIREYARQIVAASPPPPAPPVPPTEPPVVDPASSRNRTPVLVRRVKISRPKFHVGQKGQFRYNISEPSAIEVTFKRRGKKRVVGNRTYRGRAGANKNAFIGKVISGKKRLAAGRYIAELVAKDAEGNKSKPSRVSFQIAKR